MGFLHALGGTPNAVGGFKPGSVVVSPVSSYQAVGEPISFPVDNIHPQLGAGPNSRITITQPAVPEPVTPALVLIGLDWIVTFGAKPLVSRVDCLFNR